jgi:hypothetical protein
MRWAIRLKTEGVLRYFEWVLRGEGTEPLLLRKNREDIEYGTQELRNEW